MDISGPLSVPSTQRDEPSLTLRLNQRFSAEVLQVSGDRVYLEVDGVQIVAKMTSPEQAVALASRRMASFVVRDLTGQTIGLQLAAAAAEGTAAAAAEPESDLVANLLSNFGLPLTEENTTIAQALLKQGIQVTPEMIDELRNLLNQAKAAQAKEAGAQGAQVPWGQTEAQTAAMLKAAGLPVTAGTLNLATTDPAQLTDAFARLQARLAEFAKGDLSPGLNSLVQDALSQLSKMVVDWSASSSDMAESLRQAVTHMGRSLESQLADLVNKGANSLSDAQSESLLMTLTQLRKELARTGAGSLLNEIDRFVDELRTRQFKNSEPTTQPLKEQWLNLDVLLGLPGSSAKNYSEMQSSPLRVSFHTEDDARKIDMAHSRLVIQVELGDQETLQVDLSIVAHQIGAWVTATSDQLLDDAKTNLPELKDGLEKIGYDLKSVHWEVGNLDAEKSDETGKSAWANFREINLKV